MKMLYIYKIELINPTKPQINGDDLNRLKTFSFDQII